MDRLTRKDLKTDKFAVEVGNTVEYLEEHRKQATVIGAAVLAIVLIVVGVYYYQQGQHAQRQAALREALRTFDANISETVDPFFVTFKTPEEKTEAVDKAFADIAHQYSGSDEAAIATFYLGISANSQGKTEEAEKQFRNALDAGVQPYSSQAGYSLAQLCAAQGKTDEAEQILRDLIEHPTVLVSKEQATIALARLVAKRDPAEARTLLEPLRTERGAVSRAALTALGELPREQE